MIYDPTDLSSLFQDTAGSTPVTAHTDPVGRMNDKSPNGWNVIQGTAGSRPLYDVTGSVKTLSFAGTDDRLSISSGTALNVFRNKSFGTIIAGVNFTSSGTQMYAVSCSAAAGVTTLRAGLQKNTSDKAVTLGRRLDGAGSASQASTASVNGAFKALTAEFDWAGAKAHISIDLGARETLDPFLTAGTTSDTASAGFDVGSLGSGNFLIGKIGRIIVIDRELTTDEKTAAIKWVAAGHGITLS